MAGHVRPFRALFKGSHAMPNVADLLNAKGSMVHTVFRTDTVLEAAKSMNERRIGALVVVDSGYPEVPVGMFTERDVLTRVVAEERQPGTTKIGDVMTARILTCALSTDLDEVRNVMRSERIRHLPVLDNQHRLCGMISLGDLNHAQVKVLVETIQYLEMYGSRM